MVKILDDVNEWTRGTLIDLIDEGYDENTQLEFKSKIDFKTKRIPITACAFTNTKGGFLIFGIDNNRNKKLTTEERLVGLEDSDQLKSQINNQIRNIKPSIPIENIEFKESNIVLPNDKVIVILKISKSLIGPHKFDDIFYKRVANGNAPMDVDEIKNAFIESQKSLRMLSLLETEEELLIDVLKTMLLLVDDKQIGRSLNFIKHLDYSSFKHFLYNYAHFYTQETYQKIHDVIYDLNRLQRNEAAMRQDIEIEENHDGAVKVLRENITNCIEWIKDLNPLLGIEYIERDNGFFDNVSDEIKKRMAEEIKTKKANEAAIKESETK